MCFLLCLTLPSILSTFLLSPPPPPSPHPFPAHASARRACTHPHKRTQTRVERPCALTLTSCTHASGLECADFSVTFVARRGGCLPVASVSKCSQDVGATTRAVLCDGALPVSHVRDPLALQATVQGTVPLSSPECSLGRSPLR